MEGTLQKSQYSITKTMSSSVSIVSVTPAAALGQSSSTQPVMFKLELDLS